MTMEGSPEIAPQAEVASQDTPQDVVVTPEPDDSLARLGEAVLREADRIATEKVAQREKELDSKYKRIADKNTSKYQREAEFAKKVQQEKERFLMGMVGKHLGEEEQGKVYQTFQQIDQNVGQEVYRPSPEEIAQIQQVNYLEAELTKAGIRYNDPRLVRDPNNPDLFIDAAMAILEEKKAPKVKEETVRVSEVKPEPIPIVRAPDPSPAGGGSATNDEAFLKAFANGELTSPADMKRAKNIIDKLNRGG